MARRRIEPPSDLPPEAEGEEVTATVETDDAVKTSRAKTSRAKTSRAKASRAKASRAKASRAKTARAKASKGKAKQGTTSKSTGMKARREFPLRTLEEALQIPRVIDEKNHGQPWPPEEVARACGTTRKNNSFFYLSAASRDYGLTEGARDATEISITDLGRSIVQPSSSEERTRGLQTAFRSVELFRKVDDYYQKVELPEDQYLDSTVQREFGLPREYTEDFRRVFSANRKYLIGLGVSPDHTKSARLPQIDSLSIVETKVSKYERTAFVAMPFGEKGVTNRPSGFFKEVLRRVIVPACERAKFNVETASRGGSDVIQSTIIEHLIHADLVIVDLSDHNPNVLFELGVRIALDKPVVLIRAEGTPGIFDVDNMMRVVSYDPLLWIDTVSQDVERISQHVQDGWDNRARNRKYMEILAGSNWKT